MYVYTIALYVHIQQIVEIALSQYAAGMSERRLTLIDRNRDLWLYPVGGTATSKGASSKLSNSNRHKLHVQVYAAIHLAMLSAYDYRSAARYTCSATKSSHTKQGTNTLTVSSC
jgi:hypothetical protein